MGKYQKQDYLNVDPFEGDFECPSMVKMPVKVVKTRKPHTCSFHFAHIVPVGSVCRVDTAIEDGEFLTVYSCAKCMDLWIDHTNDILSLDEYFSAVEDLKSLGC